MSALDEKTKAERTLKDLQKVQGEQQVLFPITTVCDMFFIFVFYFFF